MDFELSDEQAMLRDTTRDLLGRKYDIETLRKTIDDDPGWSTQVWKQLADIGILGLVFPEEDGGAGAGDEELAAVMGEFGASLAPEPFLDSVVTPGLLAVYSGAADDVRQEFLGGLAAGDKLSAFAHHEAGDRWPSYKVATKADGDKLTGTKTLVPHGDCADTLIVSRPATATTSASTWSTRTPTASPAPRTAPTTDAAAPPSNSPAPPGPGSAAATPPPPSSTSRSSPRPHCARRPSAP